LLESTPSRRTRGGNAQGETGLLDLMRFMQDSQQNSTSQMQALQMEILRMNEIQMEKTNILIQSLTPKPSLT